MALLVQSEPGFAQCVAQACARLRERLIAAGLTLTLALAPGVSGQSQNPSPEPAPSSQQPPDLAAVEKNWRGAVAQNPSDAGAYAMLGLTLSREQKYQDAIAAYKKAIALKPKLPGIHINLGLAEFKLGHFQSAVAPLRAALAADPSNMQARTLLGLSYYGVKQFADAAAQLEEAAKADPANIQLQEVLAQSCLWAKKYSCALEQFRLIQQQQPDSVASHILMAEADDGLGHTADAIAEFQAAASVAPREPNIHFGIGYLYWKQRKYDAAKDEFQRELALEHANPQAFAYLGDIAMKENQPENALQFLRRAVQAKSDIRIAHMDMGEVLATEKKYSEAVAAFKRAETLDPSEPDAHYRLARLYREMGNTAESQKEFEKVRQMHEKTDEDVVRKISDAPPPLPQPSSPQP